MPSATSSGTTNCPSAAPSGFAKLVTAVAATRPLVVNHISEYLVGAASANGCATPVRICPNMTTPKMPPSGSALWEPA